jgi:hypothetical protein
VAGATSASAKPPGTGKKTQSGVKAANEAAEATSVPAGVSRQGGKTPTSPARRSATSGAASLVRACLRGAADKSGHSPEGRGTTSRRRANLDESEDASTECKEAGGAQDGIFNDDDEIKEDNKDNEDDKESEGEDSGNNAELALLRQEMDALEHCMYSKGTVALVFARTVTQALLAG